MKPLMPEYKTDKFDLKSTPYGKFNIRGVEVEIRKSPEEVCINVWFCAYAELKNSRYLNDSFLGNPTFREGDIIGVDTMRAWNQTHTIDERLANALHQIEYVIEKYQESMKEVENDRRKLDI